MLGMPSRQCSLLIPLNCLQYEVLHLRQPRLEAAVFKRMVNTACTYLYSNLSMCLVKEVLHVSYLCYCSVHFLPIHLPCSLFLLALVLLAPSVNITNDLSTFLGQDLNVSERPELTSAKVVISGGLSICSTNQTANGMGGIFFCRKGNEKWRELSTLV